MSNFSDEVHEGIITDEDGNYDHYDPYYLRYLIYSKLVIETEKERYGQEIQSYESIIRRTAAFINEQNVNDDIDRFNLFNYLLWNGKFSINNEYKYSIASFKSLIGYQGMNVMTGRGVCRHNADLLSRIIKGAGSHAMYTPVLYRKGKFSYRPDIKREIEQPSLLVKAAHLLIYPIQMTFLNHAIVVIGKDGHYYALDPTNLCIFKLDDYFTWSVMNGTGSAKARDIILGFDDRTNEDEIINVINSCECEDSPYLTDEYVREKSEDMLMFCRKNDELFNDFHSEILSDIKIVNNVLTKRKVA